MKKVLSIVVFSIIIILIVVSPVMATNGEMNRLKLKVVEANENYQLFILLPKQYIKYAIQHDGLDIDYDGANTLKYNQIPSITVDVNKVVDNTYIDENIEYVQIELSDLGGNEYLFEIISEYTNMDMLYRVKSQSRDYIMVISNFTIQNNVCNIEYNYAENTIKTEKKNDVQFRFNIKWWQIVVISLLIICVIFLQNRRNY